MPNKVGARYQVVIDKKARRELGVMPGDLATQRVEDGRLIIEFIPAPHHRPLLGILRQPGSEPITDWQAVKERAWRMRSEEIMEVLRRDSERHRSQDRR
jgi:bifunctional DNA-binding transcriptional regulator/antitoxin component of YhaV-PrlF toxin-antitoxin module